MGKAIAPGDPFGNKSVIGSLRLGLAGLTQIVAFPVDFDEGLPTGLVISKGRGAGFLLLLHRGSCRRPVSLTGRSQGICRADGVSGIR